MNGVVDGEGMSTTELLALLSARLEERVSRNVLTRLREQYRGRIPTPRSLGVPCFGPLRPKK